MRALEELEAGVGDVHRLERVDEAEDLGPVARAVELAQLLDEGEDGRAHHDVIEHLGVARDAREVAGEAGLGRRNGDLRHDLAPLRFHRFGEEVAVVVAEGIVREDHRDLLAEVLRDPGRHRRDLRAHVGDARLQRPAVQLARGDVIAFRADQIGDLQFGRPGGCGDHHMAEERPEDHVHLGLRGQLLDHLGTAARVGRIVLEQDLDRTPGDAARLVHHLQRGERRPLVPPPVGRADPGAMELEPQPDRLGALRLHEAGQGRGRQGGSPSGKQRTAGGMQDRLAVHGSLHGGQGPEVESPQRKTLEARFFKQ